MVTETCCFAHKQLFPEHRVTMRDQKKAKKKQWLAAKQTRRVSAAEQLAPPGKGHCWVHSCTGSRPQLNISTNQLQAVKLYKLLEPKVLAKLGLQTGHPTSLLNTKAGLAWEPPSMAPESSQPCPQGKLDKEEMQVVTGVPTQCKQRKSKPTPGVDIHCLCTILL